MLSDHHHQESPINIRDVHPLTPPTNGHRSSSQSISSNSSTENNFTTISREFNALVLAGSVIRPETQSDRPNYNLGRIGEEHNNLHEENCNPLAIVLDRNPPPRGGGGGGGGGVISMRRGVKKEEAGTRISAWQNAKMAKINNRFKREDVIIAGFEGKKVDKATSRMKKVEREIEEKRAKALEKMENDIAKAHRKAEEKRASAEAKRGTKVARVLGTANLMRSIGRTPKKHFLLSYNI
ncbi:hypothetical protein DH2020_038901 [Rehmannia glutinosa]|uniref:Remorin C-terminal domain-containing protein n=1 Tax=Rehmannia glutinosa TaxID=99300 RepID=A0ABR0UXB5_REHGL